MWAISIPRSSAALTSTAALIGPVEAMNRSLGDRSSRASAERRPLAQNREHLEWRETFDEGVFAGQMVGEDGDLGPRVQRWPVRQHQSQTLVIVKDCYAHGLPDPANRRRPFAQISD